MYPHKKKSLPLILHTKHHELGHGLHIYYLGRPGSAQIIHDARWIWARAGLKSKFFG